MQNLENPEAAQWFLLLAYGTIGFVMLCGALADLWLDATGRPTITSVWRAHPGWFWPAWGMLLAHLVVLAVHVLWR